MRNVNAESLELDRTVRELGWAVQFVGGEAGHPSFAYTVGLLRQYRHPEFVLVGVPLAAATTLDVLGAKVRDGTVFEAGDQPDEVLPGYRTELVAVDMIKSRHELLAAWNLNDQPVPALQMVWPDEGNRLPWEPGYSLAGRAQPLWGERGQPLAEVRRNADGTWTSAVRGREP
jgi:hypothetical protein